MHGRQRQVDRACEQVGEKEDAQQVAIQRAQEVRSWCWTDEARCETDAQHQEGLWRAGTAAGRAGVQLGRGGRQGARGSAATRLLQLAQRRGGICRRLAQRRRSTAGDPDDLCQAKKYVQCEVVQK